MKLRSIRGQVTTEYILLIAFIVAILVGVSGILTKQVNDLGAYIENEASKVMSQRELGIPTNWFLAQVGGDFDTGGDPDGGAGPGGNGPGGNGPGGNGPGGNGPGGNGPGGDTVGNFTEGDDTADNGGEDNASGGGTSGNAASFEEESGRSGRRRGTTGGVVYVEGEETDAEVSGTDEQDQEDGTKEEEEAAAEGGSGAERRRFALENEQDTRRSTCEDFDLYKLLKILAIIALVVVGGAYLFTGLGNKGGHKK